MAYPLKDWKTFKRAYTFGVKTFYSDFHLGLDVVCPTGTPLYAWADCTVKSLYGTDGGNTAWVYTDGKLFRFLHLKERPKDGSYKSGEQFAITNNTGKSTGSHVHIDISKNGKLELSNRANFIDPEKYFTDIQPKEPVVNSTPIPVIEAVSGDKVDILPQEEENKENEYQVPITVENTPKVEISTNNAIPEVQVESLFIKILNFIRTIWDFFLRPGPR